MSGFAIPDKALKAKADAFAERMIAAHGFKAEPRADEPFDRYVERCQDEGLVALFEQRGLRDLRAIRRLKEAEAAGAMLVDLAELTVEPEERLAEQATAIRGVPFMERFAAYKARRAEFLKETA